MFRSMLRQRWAVPLRRTGARAYYESLMHEPFAAVPGRTPRWASSAKEAVEVQGIRSGTNIYIHSAAATPTRLVRAVTDYGVANQLRDIRLVHIHTEGEAPFLEEEARKTFRSTSLFTGPNVRKAIAEGQADYVPVFLSETPLLFRNRVIPLQAALVQVSPPDRHGYCSLGVSVDCSRAAVQAADVIIAQVNKHMPRTHGDGLVHVSHFDTMFECHEPIYAHQPRGRSEEEEQIGKLIAENLVQDEATLQMGIGAIPDAVLSKLNNHKNLGIHSEMFSDGILPLLEKGNITNACKSMHFGKVIGGFAVGSQKLYDWMDDNPLLNMMDIQHVNDVSIIKRQHRMTAINSCIEIDLTGQVVSDSIGERIYSGVGGQVDFLRGAGVCPDGRSILALPSQTKHGDTRIVPTCKEGGGVVTTRAHVRYVVTEWGIAELFGKTLRERARALIDIAHPDHREELHKAACHRLMCGV